MSAGFNVNALYQQKIASVRQQYDEKMGLVQAAQTRFSDVLADVLGQAPASDVVPGENAQVEAARAAQEPSVPAAPAANDAQAQFNQMLSLMANSMMMSSMSGLSGGSGGGDSGSSISSMMSMMMLNNMMQQQNSLSALQSSAATAASAADPASASTPASPAAAAAAAYQNAAVPTSPTAYEELIQQAAAEYALSPALIKGVIRAESSFRPQDVSSAGAQGLMQLMPGTAAELGVTDPFDPAQNVDGGARYLKQMIERYGGDVRVALAAYNCGPGRVDSLDITSAQSPGYERLSANVRAYVDRVLRFSSAYESYGEGGEEAMG